MRRKINYDGEKATLVGDIPDPPLREVRKQIRIELGCMIRSTRLMDKTIRDENDIYGIRCLQKALKLLPKR